MCVKSSSVADYMALGLGDMASSACVAITQCYEDQDAIRLAPVRNGSSRRFATLS